MRSSISAQSWLSVPPAPGMDGHDGAALDRSRPRAASRSRAARATRSKACSSRSISPFDGLAFARQFEERVEIVGQRGDLLVVVDGFFETLAVLHHLLALFGLVPEVGLGDLLFYFVELEISWRARQR